MQSMPDNKELIVCAIAVGDMVFASFPGEPFTEIGVKIKETEGYRMILPCALTNGDMGYFPVQSAYDEGGYEAKTSPFKAGVAERIIEGAKELLSDIR